MRLRLAVLVFLIFDCLVFAQGFSRSSANIRAKLINGPIFKIVKGNLNSDEVLRWLETRLIKESQNRIQIELTGIDRNDIIVEFHRILAKKETHSFGDIDVSAVFKPVIQTSDTVDSIYPLGKIGCLTFVIRDKNPKQKSYFLISSSLKLANLVTDDFCSDTFAISVVY
jgi:hypothetical protein